MASSTILSQVVAGGTAVCGAQEGHLTLEDCRDYAELRRGRCGDECMLILLMRSFILPLMGRWAGSWDVSRLFMAGRVRQLVVEPH